MYSLERYIIYSVVIHVSIFIDGYLVNLTGIVTYRLSKYKKDSGAFKTSKNRAIFRKLNQDK